MKILKKLKKIPLYILALFTLFIIRIIRPVFLVRFGILLSPRIGHFAANTELYLCERDAGINVPKSHFYIDLFYMEVPICNHQLAKMWRSVLHVAPRWFLGPVINLNRLIPGGRIHEIGNNSQSDRDIHNLYDKFPPHLKFTKEDEIKGEIELRKMGIPIDSKLVCLTVRDSAYLQSHLGGDWSGHNYRDCDIQNYTLAALELANRGYFVIRMGAKVLNRLECNHPKIIDYATNGMRSDFMDIYLGAKCTFCISTSTGWDAVPLSLFRKPTVFTNSLPVAYNYTFSDKFIFITKRHFSTKINRELTLRDILKHNVELSLDSSEFENQGIVLIENTPIELRDVILEMQERLEGLWQASKDDDDLQRQFWKIFPLASISKTNQRPLHGMLRSRYGAKYLRENKDWLK